MDQFKKLLSLLLTLALIIANTSFLDVHAAPKKDEIVQKIQEKRIESKNLSGRIEETFNGYTITPVTYFYGKDGNEEHHFLIINLNQNLANKACFKSYIGLKEDKKIGEPYDSQNDFEARKFSAILENDNNRKLEKNGQEYEPIAAINGDYVDKNDAPMDINYSLGMDYSGTRENYTSIAISQQNSVEFTTIKQSYYADNNFSVVGGGPVLVKNNEVRNICLLNPVLCGSGIRWAKQSRSMVGITDQNYMVLFVGDNIDANNLHLYEILNKYNGNYGAIENAILFDGGGSPGIMFRKEGVKNLNEDILQQGGNPLASLLLVYTGEACQ